MRHWRLALIAAAAVAASGLPTACVKGKGGPDDTATPTTTSPTATGTAASTATPSPQLQLLEQAVLQEEDLTPGLTQVAAASATNEDVAADEGDPQKELSRLEGLGRLLGYEVNFVSGSQSPTPGPGTFAVSSAASLYRTAEGASSSFAADAKEARDADWPAAYPDLTELQVREVPRSDLADEVLWVRISGLQSAQGNSLFIEDFVVLRRGRLRGFLRVVSLVEPSTGSDGLLTDVADMAARQVEHMDTVLKEG